MYSSDQKKSFGFYIATCVIQWAGFGLIISSVTNKDWTHIGVLRFGLFEYCSLGTCSAIPNESWLHAVRAFMIMALPLTLTAGILNHISSCKYPKRLRKIAAALFLVAGIFAIIGVSVYTSYSRGTTYGAGYIIAWVGTWLVFFSGVFAAMSANYSDDQCFK